MFVRGTEVVDVGFSEGRTGELNVLTSSVRADVEALPFEERVGLHAPVLIRRAHHGVPVLHRRRRLPREPGGLQLRVTD